MVGNIGLYTSLLPWAAEEEFNIFIYDYQGFGASEGDPGFQNFKPDAHAVVNYLLSRPEPSAHVIIHLGGSLGSLVALPSAADFPDSTIGVVVYGGFFPEQVMGLWLGTFVSPLLAPLGDLASFSWAASLPDFMNPHLAIPHIEAPVFVIVPENDSIVVPETQLNLFDALPEPKELYSSSAPHSPWAIDEDPDTGRAILQWARQLEGLLPAEP
jgi:pimeloyl-ACP methyl ester carboxylesterase